MGARWDDRGNTSPDPRDAKVGPLLAVLMLAAVLSVVVLMILAARDDNHRCPEGTAWAQETNRCVP